MLDTLADRCRFRGTSYEAASSIFLGGTQGRGRTNREHAAHSQAAKEIYVLHYAALDGLDLIAKKWFCEEP